MRRTSPSLGLALLALCGCAGPAFTPLDRWAKHADAGALGWWYGNDTYSLDFGEKPIARLLREKCAVRKMGAAKSGFFVRVAAHADRAVTSPAFSTMVKARASFPLTKDSGAQVMDRVRWAGVQINVFMYERDKDHPCHDKELADGDTNAFTPMPGNSDVHLLFLYEPYVEAAMQVNAVRELARTLVHESLHSMGYSHAGLEVGSEAYNNAVPIYVACLVEHWGGKAHQEWIKQNCHRADSDRTKAPD